MREFLRAWNGTICIGNYTVREVLVKNRTRVWRNIYNIASSFGMHCARCTSCNTNCVDLIKGEYNIAF